MISAQRRALVLDQLRRLGGASIVSLAQTIGVSPSTIRRDLDFLTEGGYITRSHGGAMLLERPGTTFEPQRDIGANIASSAKASIGARAVDMLEAGQSIIFDSSSTVLEAAKVIVARQMRLTACTNDIGTAAVLAGSDMLNLVVLGGTNRRGSLTLIGDPGLSFLNSIHVDIALIGIHSLFGQRLSETSIDLAAMKRRMISSASRVAVLADSSKFDHPAFCDVASVNEIDVIVTDSGIKQAHKEALEEAEVEVIIVDAGQPAG